MADVRPFRGLRFDLSRVPLSDALCPPYDVIGPEAAAKLRRGRFNAVHLELPAGSGASKYKAAAALWRRWRDERVLRADPAPSFYVVEERFRWGGQARVRRGFLAALGSTDKNARFVIAHERTLPKPKADRLRMLGALRANISPIFGVFPDPSGAARRALASGRRGAPEASGRTAAGVAYRLWRLDDPEAIGRLRRELRRRRILIADGHHRFEVSRAFWRAGRRPENETVLAYLCPEEDPGLVVLSTHRVLAETSLRPRAEKPCRLERCGTLGQLWKRLERAPNPYAFGLCEGGELWLCSPRGNGGARSGMCVEWLGRHLLAEVPPDRIVYTPEPAEALKLARKTLGAAVLVKPFPVAQVRKAVDAVGLLPPKSTYFFPKVSTGLAFKPLEKDATPAAL